MKKTYAFLMALFFCVAAAAQGLLPEFSTEDNPVWYRDALQSQRRWGKLRARRDREYELESL